jgi:uncharacterized membrane protein
MMAENEDWAALPLYLTAALLFLVPTIDGLLGTYPFHFGSAMWRFGAMGAMTRVIMTPMLALLMAMVAAGAWHHWKTLRRLGMLAAFIAVVIFLCVGLFGLDGIQVRAIATRTGQPAYTTATIYATIKYLVCDVAFAVMAWKALKKTGKRLSRERTAEAGAAGLLVR